MACRSSAKKNQDRQYEMVNDAQSALNSLSAAGFMPGNPVSQAISGVMGRALGGIGVHIPRLPGLLGTLFHLSPGTLRIWYDPELHFMIEARRDSSAIPVYKGIDVDTAIRLLRPDPDLDLAHSFMELTEYVGEE